MRARAIKLNTMASRDIADLSPGFRAQVEILQDEADFIGFDLLIYCTQRELVEQARLYRVGRSLERIKRKADELAEQWNRPDLAMMLMEVGPQQGAHKLTYAGPGQSYHNYGLAVDAVPLREGRPVWGVECKEDRALWKELGKLAKTVSLDWGGDWARFKDYPHIQQKNINWREMIAGAVR